MTEDRGTRDHPIGGVASRNSLLDANSSFGSKCPNDLTACCFYPHDENAVRPTSRIGPPHG